jgi:channel protein (hemolysin III family)
MGRDSAAPWPPATEFPQYATAERRADAAVHAVGLAFGLSACLILGRAMRSGGHDLGTIAALAVYAGGLMAMLACSALYNLAEDGARKRLYRRLDHAAIFLMIAGTYTPFMLVALGGAWGVGLLAVVWTAAAAGIAVELLDRGRHDNLSVAAYLLLGWVLIVPPYKLRDGGTRMDEKASLWQWQRRGTFGSQADCLVARNKGIDAAKDDTAWAEAQEARCFTEERANGGPMNPSEDPSYAR